MKQNSIQKQYNMQIDIYLITGRAKSIWGPQGWVDVSLRLKRMGYSVWDDYSHHRYRMHQSISPDDMMERRELIKASKCVLVYDYLYSLRSSAIFDLGVAIENGIPIIVVGELGGISLEDAKEVKLRLPWVTVQNWEDMMKHFYSVCGHYKPVSAVKRIEWKGQLEYPDDPIPATSKRTGKMGYRDKNGRSRCQYKYRFTHHFSDGMGLVTFDGKDGFLDRSLREVIAPQYDFARHFRCGLAPVGKKMDDGSIKWGYIDKENSMVVPFVYDGAETFEPCGLAHVQQERKHGLIDTSGKLVLPIDYDLVCINDIREDKPGIVIKNGKYGFVNVQGKIVVEPQYDKSFGFSDGIAACKMGDTLFLIDLAGNHLTELNFDAAMYFAEGLLPVAHHFSLIDLVESWGFCNKEGNEVIPCEYEAVLPFSEGYAAVCHHGKWGYIDHQNRVMIPFQFDYVECGNGKTGFFGNDAEGIARVMLYGNRPGEEDHRIIAINKLGQDFLDDKMLNLMPMYERGKLINYPIENIIGLPREAVYLRHMGINPQEYYLTNILASLMKHRMKEHPEERQIYPKKLKNVK